MKLINKVCIAALALTALPSLAQTELVVRGRDGKDITTELLKISEITFSEEGMTIVSTDGKQIVPFSGIAELSFVDKKTGVSDASADLGDVKVSLANGQLTAVAEGEIKLTVYDMQGKPVVTAAGDSELSLDFQPLAKGIYIVKVNDKIIKVNR